MKDYCIRAGYKPRTEAVTYVADPREYWNRTRVRTSAIYQYHVYRRVAELLAEMPQRSFADVGCGYPFKVKQLISPLTDEITLFDQPSMETMIATHFPGMRFIALNLEIAGDAPEAKYDCIVCADVIEHLLNPDSLLTLIRSLAKPESVIVLSTPERDIVRGPDCMASPKAEHVREWNSQEFAEYVGQSGFKVLEHSLVPSRKLTLVEEHLMPRALRWKTKRYCGCQMIVCTLK